MERDASIFRVIAAELLLSGCSLRFLSFKFIRRRPAAGESQDSIANGAALVIARLQLATGIPGRPVGRKAHNDRDMYAPEIDFYISHRDRRYSGLTGRTGGEAGPDLQVATWQGLGDLVN